MKNHITAYDRRKTASKRSQVIAPVYESPCTNAELQNSDINVGCQRKYVIKGQSEKQPLFSL